MPRNKFGLLLDLGDGFYVEIVPSGYALCKAWERGLTTIEFFDSLKEALVAFYEKTKDKKRKA